VLSMEVLMISVH